MSPEILPYGDAYAQSVQKALSNNKHIPASPVSHTNFVYFDIETIPSQNESYADRVANTISHPKAMKKQETIDDWELNKKPQAIEDAVAKSSFDGGRGHVCCISWVKNNDIIEVRYASTVEDERDVIKGFFADLDPYHSQTLVGHNIARFDIPFLLKRAVVLGIKLPNALTFPRDPKPWSDRVHDTMIMWAGAKDFISMDELADIMGFEGKKGFDGSMVAEAWDNGEFDRIAEYAKSDVALVRKIHQKFMKAGW